MDFTSVFCVPADVPALTIGDYIQASSQYNRTNAAFFAEPARLIFLLDTRIALSPAAMYRRVLRAALTDPWT